MSGHNRWSKLKRFKAVQGVAKGKLYSKLIKEITVAARMGGGDPAGNPRLRTAVELAREANMPQENIVRAVKKGTGELQGVNYEEAVYEGYGPAGVAMVVECLTDNKHRTAGDVRNAFATGGGNLAAEGAVAWNFDRRGVIEVKPGPTEDRVIEAAILGGAEDVVGLGAGGAEGFEVRTHPNDLHAVAAALEARRFALGGRRLAYLPRDTVKLTDPEKARQLLKLVDLLEDQDDVQSVHANFEIDDAVMDQVAV
jgi:YebC/PmpR family DNA-binding regulatory protein